MLPDPLHPAVVHFPMALAALLPLSALVGLWAIRRDGRATHIWAVPLALAVLLTGTGWLALQTGEQEEERVEEIVGDDPIHEHEEAAERFLLLSGVVTLLFGAGLAKGTLGSSARLLATVGSVAVLAAGIQTGHAGGELVYGHNAGAAYTLDGGASSTAPAAVDDDDERH